MISMNNFLRFIIFFIFYDPLHSVYVGGRIYGICSCPGPEMTNPSTTIMMVTSAPTFPDDEILPDPTDPTETGTTAPYRRRRNKIILKGLTKNQKVRSSPEIRQNNPRNARTGIALKSKDYSKNKKGKKFNN